MTDAYKVRFGYTIGPETDPLRFPALIDELERREFDSVWIPEAFLAPTLDPIVALTHAAARTTRLKLGSHLVIPGKNPVQLAKQLANLDCLSDGRLLIVGVLGLPDEADRGAQIMERKERAAALDEVVPLLRRLWTGEAVTHHGERYRFDDVTVTPRPVQDPLEIWLAGQVPSALRRAGTLGDGYMPGLVMPSRGRELRKAVVDAAEAAGRVADPEHFGVNLFFSPQPLPEDLHARLAARARDGVAVEDLVPIGFDALRERVDEWLDAGFSKFLLRPMHDPADPVAELARLADEMLGLTT